MLWDGQNLHLSVCSVVEATLISVSVRNSVAGLDWTPIWEVEGTADLNPAEVIPLGSTVPGMTTIVSQEHQPEVGDQLYVQVLGDDTIYGMWDVLDGPMEVGVWERADGSSGISPCLDER
jgi:hypothetical protein